MNQNDKAKLKHEKWLLKNNCHPSQIKERKKPVKKLTGFSVSKEYYGNLANTVAPNPLDNSIWERVRKGEETPETIREIQRKATQCVPLFNKGGIQYSTDEKELKNAGRKTAI